MWREPEGPRAPGTIVRPSNAKSQTIRFGAAEDRPRTAFVRGSNLARLRLLWVESGRSPNVCFGWKADSHPRIAERRALR